MAKEQSIVKQIESALDDLLALSRRRPIVSLIVVLLIAAPFSYRLLLPEDDTSGKSEIKVTVQGFNLEEYERELWKRFELEAQLKKAQSELEGAKTGRDLLSREVTQLKDQLATASQRLKKLDATGGVIYRRFVIWDVLKTSTIDIVYLAEGKPKLDGWIFLPELRRVRRLGASTKVLGVGPSSIPIDARESDAFLNPIFWPGDDVCTPKECGVVRKALPGIIPLYEVTLGNSEITVAWYENTLRSGVEFKHEIEGKAMSGRLLGTGGLAEQTGGFVMAPLGD